MDTDPPPSQVIIMQTCTVSVTVEQPGGMGSYDDGLGQSGPVSFDPPAHLTGSATDTKYQVMPGGATVALKDLNAKATVTNSPASASLSYTATISPVTITLGGTTPDSSGNPNILVGQQCTATVNGIPTGNGWSATYQWNVSGTTFESWGVVSDPNGQSHTTEVDAIPATNPTQWYWNDVQNTPETVKCTVMVTPPTGQGSPFPVTVSAPNPISVQVPESFQAVGVGGYMQVNKAIPDDTAHNNLWAGPTTYELSTGALPGGMNWQASVTTPTTPAFGTGKLEMVQLVTPNNSYTTVANPTVTVTDPENKNSDSLDGMYPYGSVASEVAGSSSPIYKDDDAPGLQLDGTNLLATANKGGSYTDYMMYIPPVAANSASTWILLGTFSWSASGSATIPGNKNWSSYTSTSVTGVSDGAGAVTPPGSNPPQDSLPTPVPFTSVTKGNTFPKWSHTDLGGSF